MRHSKSAIVMLVCQLTVVFGASAKTSQGQALTSTEQRIEAVNNHLSRYIKLTNAHNDHLMLTSQMATLHVPAVSIATIKDGHIDWTRAYGVTSLAGPSATTATIFGAASFSKPVTALGVLRLVEQGKIDLDTDVNRYLKRWKIPNNEFTVDHKVTVRELLSHTSGIGTHNGAIYDPALPFPKLLAMLDGEKPATTTPVRVDTPPDTKFAYANGGYLILYLLIEDVTGKSFSNYMKHAVLQPAGMSDSTFNAPLPSDMVKRAATSYTAKGTAVPPEKYVEPNLAAGGLWTTPTDMAKLLIEIQKEFLGKSHKILRQKTIRSMVTPGKYAVMGAFWELGFQVGGTPDDPYIRHAGSAYFQNDMVVYLRGSGIVVMTSGANGGAIAEELLRSAGAVYSFPDFKAVEHAVADVNPSSLPRFVGTYAYIEVARDGDFLTAEIPKGATPARLYPKSPTRFFVLDGPQELEFEVNSEQKVTGVAFITPINHQLLKKDK